MFQKKKKSGNVRCNGYVQNPPIKQQQQAKIALNQL